jgi:hypothetical protein
MGLKLNAPRSDAMVSQHLSSCATPLRSKCYASNVRGLRPAPGTERAAHCEEGCWEGGRACASPSIGYQRFLDLNLSFMRLLVRACVKALKNAQIIPSTAEQEKMVGVQPCNLSTL